MWNNERNETAGGFMNESMDSTQVGGSGKRGTQSNEKAIVPLMIKHITSSTGDLQIAGKTVSTVTIVGVVRHIEEETTKISYEIRDDTGTILAVMWLEADKPPVGNVQINTYVRVHGLIRDQNNKRHLLILSIRPLEDLNELPCHFLEVMRFTLEAKKLAEGPDVQPSTDTVAFDSTMTGMSSEQMTVLEIVRSANDVECGIEKRDILTKLPKNIVSRLEEILDFLLSEGHIYTTSSEDFFKAT